MCLCMPASGASSSIACTSGPCSLVPDDDCRCALAVTVASCMQRLGSVILRDLPQAWSRL
jgi:hypothetical protein